MILNYPAWNLNLKIFLKGLVDYEGDSDEEEEEGSDLSPSAKRARVT